MPYKVPGSGQEGAGGEASPHAALPVIEIRGLETRFGRTLIHRDIDLRVEAGQIAEARIAFGGMAGIPKRAPHVEAALIGQPFTPEGIAAARAAFALDFQPLSDMRASAEYRLTTARNLLTRYVLEMTGTAVDLQEVSA